MREAGLYADRLSMNLEIQLNQDSNYWPDKNHQDMINPMRFVKNELIQYKKKRKIQSTPKFAPAGQSTQVIVEQRKKTIFKSFKLPIIL
jgi:predicted DNA-binding helix-hairpin-helix protein